jgi:NAD-reducing hydrogenase large subunit
VMMRKYGQEIIKATAGKKVHGTGAIPGGVNKNLPIEERDRFLNELNQQMTWARSALKLAKDYTVGKLDELKGFAAFDSNYMSIVTEDGTLDLYDGRLRAIDSQGDIIFDQVPPERYIDVLAEDVRHWSYMKFPFIRSLGSEAGWYRVGPLARMNTAERLDTPEAEQARREFAAVTKGKPNGLTMAYHWARMIELLHSLEKIAVLLNDPDLQGSDLVVIGERREEGVGIIEAPRGTLFHHYRVNAQDQVVMANLIVSTTSNNDAMNLAVKKVAESHLQGVKEVTEGLLNHVEVAIRAYDPCLSCATHAVGQMPLLVELFDHVGTKIAERMKGPRQ